MPSETVQSLIDTVRTIRRLNIQLWGTVGQLDYRAPAQAMTADIVSRIRAYKPVLLEILRDQGRQRPLFSPCGDASCADPYPLTAMQISMLDSYRQVRNPTQFHPQVS